MSPLRKALAVATESERLAVGNVIGAAAGLFYLIAAARILGAERFSDIALCLSLSYVGLLFLGPLNMTLIRFSASYRDTSRTAQIRPLLRRSLRVYAPWVAGTILLVAVFAVPLARALNMDSALLLPWTGVFVALGLALGAARAVAIGMHEHGLYGESLFVDTGVRIAAGLLFIVVFQTAGAALAGFLLGAGAALAVIGLRVRHLLPATGEPWGGGSETSRFMTAALFSAAVIAGLQNLDMIAVKARLSGADAGHYAVALSAARSLLLLAAPFASIALARDAPRTSRAPLVSYVALGAPVVAAIAVAPALWLRVLYGQAPPTQVQLLPLLAAALLIAGAFLILAHTEIRHRRFAFLIPAGSILVVEQVLLMAVRPSATTFAWIVLATHAAALSTLLLARVVVRPAPLTEAGVNVPAAAAWTSRERE